MKAQRHSRGEDILLHYASTHQAERPHVILLDLHLPGMGGLEVLRELRKRYPGHDVAIYILTASIDENDTIQAMIAGANAFISKTRMREDLIHHLENYLHSTNHHRIETIKRLGIHVAELALQAEFHESSVVLTDQEGRVVWFNEPFQDMCGYAYEEMRGKKPGAVLQGPASDARVIAQMRAAHHLARPFEGELINYRKSGEPYRVRISMGPIFHEDKLSGFLAVERDLSKV